MVPSRTLRRKLQKKKKRKPYGKCPLCSSRVKKYITDAYGNVPRLFGVCTNHRKPCGYRKEYFWSGGGTADT